MNLFIAALSLINLTQPQIEIENPYMQPDSVIYDASMANEDVELHFHFKTYDNSVFVKSTSIQYSVDGTERSFKPSSDEALTVETSEGSHRLQFYLNENYYEVYTSIQNEGQHHYYYTVYFENAERLIMSEKPVIYLYPETTSSVEVKVEPKGELTFTYPLYNGGWSVEAEPDGTLKMAGNTYNYLFWESEEENKHSDDLFETGYLVEGKKAATWLGEKLDQAGLNSQEKADFITYWGPRMAQQDQLLVHFVFNEDCNTFAELDVTPTPDQSYRIYILWKPVNGAVHQPKEQPIPKIDRTGFTLVEWGGQELPSEKNNSNP